MNLGGKRMSQAIKSAAIAVCALGFGALAAGNARAGQASPLGTLQVPRFTGRGAAECRSARSDFLGKTPRRLASATDAAAVDPASASARSLQLHGDAAALRLDLHQVPTIDVLAALHSAFHLEVQTAIALNAPLSGTYTGSLAQVVARVLDGYDYVIRRDSATLEASVFGKAGTRAVADPGLIPLRQR